jgi:hypothetical protein
MNIGKKNDNEYKWKYETRNKQQRRKIPKKRIINKHRCQIYIKKINLNEVDDNNEN